MTLRLSLHFTPPYQGLNRFALALDAELSLQQVTAIYGNSGSGKTSVLRCIAGLEKPTHSKIFFHDEIWLASTHKINHFIPPEKRQIGYVFQDTQLLPHLNVSENLDYAYKRRFNTTGPTKQEIIHWLGLEKLLQQRPSELSGGQKQRTAIGRSLLSAPRLLLMDEPLGALDQQAKLSILPYLDNITAQLKIPIIYVSHSLDEVCHLADQLILIEHGRILSQGALIDVLTEVKSPLAHEEDAATIVRCKIIAHDQKYDLTKLQLESPDKTGNLSDSAQFLYVARMDKPVGEQLRVRIPARDISIALHNHTDSSILNRLSGTIETIEHSTTARALLIIDINGQKLLARITRKSLDKLALVVGNRVYVQIKSVALIIG